MAVHHSFDPKSIPTNHQSGKNLVQTNKMQLSFVHVQSTCTSVNNTSGHLIGCGKKSKIMQKFWAKLCGRK